MSKNASAEVKREIEVDEEIKNKNFKAKSLAQISTEIIKGT